MAARDSNTKYTRTHLRVSDASKAAWKAAALKEKRSMSNWICYVCDQAATVAGFPPAPAKKPPRTTT